MHHYVEWTVTFWTEFILFNQLIIDIQMCLDAKAPISQKGRKLWFKNHISV